MSKLAVFNRSYDVYIFDTQIRDLEVGGPAEPEKDEEEEDEGQSRDAMSSAHEAMLALRDVMSFVHDLLSSGYDAMSFVRPLQILCNSAG